MSNQASNINGTGTQATTKSSSSPLSVLQVRNRGDFNPFACVLLLYYRPLYNLESSQIIDSTRAYNRKAESNDLMSVINFDDNPRCKLKLSNRISNHDSLPDHRTWLCMSETQIELVSLSFTSLVFSNKKQNNAKLVCYRAPRPNNEIPT